MEVFHAFADHIEDADVLWSARRALLPAADTGRPCFYSGESGPMWAAMREAVKLVKGDSDMENTDLRLGMKQIILALPITNRGSVPVHPSWQNEVHISKRTVQQELGIFPGP